MLTEEPRRRLRVEDLHQQELAPGLHRVEHPHQPAHVGDGEHDRDLVGVDALHRPLHADVGRREAEVGVHRALRVGDGARRVEDPTPLCGVGRRWPERRWVTLGQIGIGGHDLDAETLGGLAGHRPVVEAAERSRHHEQLAAGLVRDEAHFAMAVDGQDRVLHRAQARQRGGEDECLHARRQDPRYWRALGDTAVGQARGHSLGPLPKGAVGERATLLVERHHLVGAGGGALLDQFPQRLAGDVERWVHHELRHPADACVQAMIRT